MENKSNIENIIITDEDLNFLISNQKISARLLSLIEIVDKMILNQFFESYNEFLKSYLNDYGEPFPFKQNGELANRPTRDNFEKCTKFYEKLLSKYFDNKDVDKSDLENENIRYPFDVFGTDNFLRFFLSIEDQSQNIFFKNFFNINLKKKLLLDFIDINDFITNIFRIKQLRNYIEHNGILEKREDKIKFLGINNTKKLNEEKYSKIAQTNFVLLKSLQSIFIFLPDVELSEFYQLIIAERNKENTKNNIIIDNDEFKKNLTNLFNWAKKQNQKTIIKISKTLTEEDKEYFSKIKDYWNTKNRLIQKNYSLYEFIKLYNLIGEFNITKIKHILKEFLEFYPNQKVNLKPSDVQKITFEEIYKIFYFFISINEIIRITFIRVYEKLNNYVENQESFIILKNELETEKDKTKKQSIEKKLHKLVIKSHIAELVRNNIAHVNLFFYLTNDKNINIKNLDNYADIFYIYISEIFKFYNIKYNKKIYKKLNLKTTIKQEKALFIKKFSSLLLKKDYLFLLVPEETKNKKGIKSIKYEIQKLSISTDNKDTKEAFKKVIKEKIKNIIDNPNKNIKGQIRVMKYKFYYFLKSVLIKELNLIKAKDLEK